MIINLMNLEKKNIPGDNKVLDVSRYIINFCKDNEISITNLKLQKLLYFCQASYLIQTEGKSACFEEPIIAWPYGPVVYEVYKEFSYFGSSEISKINNFDKKVIVNDNFFIGVLKRSANKNPFTLVKITHAQDPWIDSFKMGQGTEISNNSIYKYFSKKFSR